MNTHPSSVINPHRLGHAFAYHLADMPPAANRLVNFLTSLDPDEWQALEDALVTWGVVLRLKPLIDDIADGNPDNDGWMTLAAMILERTTYTYDDYLEEWGDEGAEPLEESDWIAAGRPHV